MAEIIPKGGKTRVQGGKVPLGSPQIRLLSRLKCMRNQLKSNPLPSECKSVALSDTTH